MRDETKWLPGAPRPMRGDGAPTPGSSHLGLGRTLPRVFAMRGIPYYQETGVLEVERCCTLRPAASNTPLWSFILVRRVA